MAANFAYIRPRTLEQTVQQLDNEGAHLHAGGTDLLGCLRDGVFDATKLVSLSGLDELRGIKDRRGGALKSCPHSCLATSPTLRVETP